jgi:hypothetical protein
MSPAALKRRAEKLARELGMDQESRPRDAELRKRADMARLEIALGEDIGAAERREREARELRKRADELALQVATGDFDLKLGRNCEDNHKSVPNDTSLPSSAEVAGSS